MFGKKKKVIQKVEEAPLFHLDFKPEIPPLPETDDKRAVNIRYPLIPPYAYAHIYWEESSKELIYKVEEPELTSYEKRVLGILEEGIKELINISFVSVQESDTLIKYLEKNIRVLLDELRIKLTKYSYLKLMYYIYRDFVGLNEIEPFLNDYFIEDIECNGVDSQVYIVHRKYRNLRSNISFTDIKKLTSFVEKLAQKCGQYVSYATPLLDGALPDGSRVNATFTEEISTRGPTFTIRKFTKEPWSPIQLMKFGTVSPELLAYLWILIEHESNIMIIGGTGSGKTTFLNALTFFIPPQARIVSIEDTRELNLKHDNWLPSVARAGVGLANLIGQKYGEVSLFDLLKESFRQRPDYVIVGEVRGQEAFVLFQGMASGHPSFSTMHANSVDTMIKRLQTPPINLSPSLVETLDVVCVMVQTKIRGKAVRRIREVNEIINVDEKGNAILSTPFIWDAQKDSFFFKTDSYIFRKLYAQQGLSRQGLDREFKLRTKLLVRLYQHKIFNFKEVQDIINEYYKSPETVLRRFRVI